MIMTNYIHVKFWIGLIQDPYSVSLELMDGIEINYELKVRSVQGLSC